MNRGDPASSARCDRGGRHDGRPGCVPVRARVRRLAGAGAPAPRDRGAGAAAGHQQARGHVFADSTHPRGAIGAHAMRGVFSPAVRDRRGTGQRRTSAVHLGQHHPGQYKAAICLPRHADKRSLHGTYHRLSSKHLPRYLAEFSYRFNRRFSLREMFPRSGRCFPTRIRRPANRAHALPSAQTRRELCVVSRLSLVRNQERHCARIRCSDDIRLNWLEKLTEFSGAIRVSNTSQSFASSARESSGWKFTRKRQIKLKYYKILLMIHRYEGSRFTKSFTCLISFCA